MDPKPRPLENKPGPGCHRRSLEMADIALLNNEEVKHSKKKKITAQASHAISVFARDAKNKVADDVSLVTSLTRGLLQILPLLTLPYLTLPHYLTTRQNKIKL